ncbi:UDP-galactopyranose mutase [uncultured Sphingomonas sp.]|uniref:UDP-galactopyranose mutase n=1 Tax=uncultured Sphingomonas sp. TaxID=158754 RepID=UPI0035CC4419
MQKHAEKNQGQPGSKPHLVDARVPTGSPTLLCLSHLRWNFVFQRPQHLMSRFARTHRVLFWEEPIYLAGLSEPRVSETVDAATGVIVLTPELAAPGRWEHEQLRDLLDGWLAANPAEGALVRWYYTPMMLPISEHLDAACTVYDCMDELANFKGASAETLELEQRLISVADLVFTGGTSLYEAKRDRHSSVHAFPSSVDVAHFARARSTVAEPADQASIPGPKLGWAGVVDERFDLDALAAVADAHPEWSLVVIGPVIKIAESELPRRANIHYLGGRDYADLPAYMSGWDVALMPFAINDATRFISPTKTPEYLAAGRPVVSTPVTDVVRHYGELDAVHLADTPETFVRACEAALAMATGADGRWLARADAQLATGSWDRTFADMSKLIGSAVAAHGKLETVVSPTGWPDRGNQYDVLIVGAGFAGSVMAERLATQSDLRVLVVDRRPHIAGNAFDHLDAAGVLIHQYGPHIFHTNSADVFGYLSNFTQWRPYEHRVLADIDGKLVPMPINRTTLNVLYDLDLKTDAEAEAYLESRAEPVAVIRTSADVVVSKVGRELYETFFQGYTRKQWGMDPSELDKSVTSRVPTRTDTDDRYFTDQFQAMPLEGYTRMFERMLDHPNIDVLLGVDYEDVREAYAHDHLVFTGPIDEYFGHRYGKLPYRSLRFVHETHDVEVFQPVAVVNYPAESTPHTRITEYKYLTGQVHPKTSITYEIPSAEGDPYYPIPRDENQALFKRYEALAVAEGDVTFVGRLATYRYYNMDQVVGQALATHRKLEAKLLNKGAGRLALQVA